MFESVFRFFFKYERLVFEQGQFVLGATRSMWLTAAVAGAAALFVVWTYWQVAALKGRDRAALLVTRLALLAVAIFAILRPVLLLKVAVPQQNFVGVVLDDSRSMQVSDEQGGPRSAFVTNQLGRPDAPLLTELAKRFELRVFRFSRAAERLQSTADLTFQGTGTRVSEALDRVRDEMSGLPVAGLVVVSDGADNADTTLDQSIAGLKARAMPVFAVGVGKERLSRDVQVTRAETPRRVLKGASLVVDVVITQSGYAGDKVPLIVEDEGRTVSTQEITLPADGESLTVKTRFKLADAGARTLRFRVPLQGNEEVTQNNQRDSLIDVYSRREKILYLEGEPRPEPKFVKLATQDDANVQVAILQRTAEATVNAPDKYLRLNVEGAEELEGGFPTTRDELFVYRGIIIGSVEAAAFTPDQQRMLEEFVAVRGGGLLALGGFRSFSEGGWAGTPLSDSLPIVMDRGTPKPVYPPLEVVVRPTRIGQSHPATQITERPEDGPAKWRELPPLTAVNTVPVADLKPGANPLLTGVDQNGREQVVLAFQRYGRGKTLVLAPQDTWMWRMHANMAVEDLTHRNLWQRLTRWLVDGVPDRVMVSATPDRVQRGEPVVLTADVVDPAYKGVNDGRITAHATAPSGKVEDVPMEWTIEHEGEYRARFTPSEDGLYKFAVDGTTKDGKDVGRGTYSLRVAPSDAEYFDAAMRAPLLRRLAEETEGRFFRAADTSTLVDAISYSGKGITVVEERELWDMPIILLLLLGLMGGEWLVPAVRAVWPRVHHRGRCQMARKGLRLLLTALLMTAVGSTALAQRGGGFNFAAGYSANTKYDGQFVFVRMAYPYNSFRNPPWSHDYPDGEVHFMKILTAVSNVTAHVEETNILNFGDPEMFKYPVIYLCEPGWWYMNEGQVKALREYFLKGGFMIVDDFPNRAWGNFDLMMSQVFPDGRWIDLDATHPIWHTFFEINSLDMTTYYDLGGRPIFRGLFEDNDPNKRMYAVANFQNDVSEYWEFSETGYKPVDESNEAYKFGVNEFIYGITH